MINNYGANILNQDYYQYELYTEFLKHTNKYLFNNQKNGLSIKYFHTRIKDDNGNFNFNYESGARHSVNTAKDNADGSRNSNIYDIYEFTPTHDATSHTYQNETDETGTTMITTGTITIFSICKPLPGDLFHYYTDEKGSTEVFKVTQVNFNKTTFDKENDDTNGSNLKSGTLNLYELTYESSAIAYSTLNKNISSGITQTVEHNFFINEFDFYFSAEEFEFYKFLIINRDSYLKEINTYYDNIKCIYHNKNIKKLETYIKTITTSLLSLIPDTVEFFETSDQLDTLTEYLDKLILMDSKINNTIKFLNKNIPSFKSKVMPGFKIVFDQFKLIDRLTDIDLDIPIEILDMNIDINNNVLGGKVKELYDNYYPFLHRVIIENDNKKMW